MQTFDIPTRNSSQPRDWTHCGNGPNPPIYLPQGLLSPSNLWCLDKTIYSKDGPLEYRFLQHLFLCKSRLSIYWIQIPELHFA